MKGARKPRPYCGSCDQKVIRMVEGGDYRWRHAFGTDPTKCPGANLKPVVQA